MREIPFLFKISSIGIYTDLCAVAQFLKTAKNSSFSTFFNSTVTAFRISATSAKWSPFNSFSNWGTENSLAEVNLDSMGVDKGL